MATNRTRNLMETRCERVGVSAFTLVDVLVSMVIITVLISMILPSIAGVREAARRVVCGSNHRQIGLGCAMFSEDNGGRLPDTVYEPKLSDRATPAPQSTNIVRKDEPLATFDGLGVLFEKEYLNAPQVFYCPSHHGEHPYARYAPIWYEDQGKIVVNYQYRGSVAFSRGQTDRLTLVSDCLATRSDYSHNVGSNVLRADFSVAWLSDPSGRLARTLPETANDAEAARLVREAWYSLDHTTTSIPIGN